MMDANLARTYTLIHAFLVKHSHVKAAQALKKSVKESLILKDDIVPKGPSLDEIIRTWKAKDSDSSSNSAVSSPIVKERNLKQKEDKSSTKLPETSSESDSESDSDSSSNSSSSRKGSSANVKERNPKQKGDKPSSKLPEASLESDSESDSDSSSSSSSSKDSIVNAKEKNPKQKGDKASSKIPKASSESDSESDSSDDDSSDSESDLSSKKKVEALKVEHRSSRTLSSNDSPSDSFSQKVKTTTVTKARSIHSSSGGESTSSDSDSSSDVGCGSPEPESKLKSKKSDTGKTPNPKGQSTSRLEKGKSSSNSSAQDTESRVTKKRRVDGAGKSVATVVDVLETEDSPIQTKKEQRAVTNNRFMRVDPSKFQPVMDNRYTAKNAPTNDYGKLAHKDLIVTRGIGFRKEKNKKKRGSYRGGEISMESHSFKFT